MIKPKRPEIGTWKVNVQKDQGKVEIKKPVTFDQLFAKYSKAGTSGRPLKKKE